ncbi:unnamed protein product, partial [Gulo gulo]
LLPGQVAAGVSPRVPAVSPLKEPPSLEKLPEEPPPHSRGKQSVQPWLDGKDLVHRGDTDREIPDVSHPGHAGALV